MNPIEVWWADIRRQLRKLAIDTEPELVEAIRRRRARLSDAKVAAWYTHRFEPGRDMNQIGQAATIRSPVSVVGKHDKHLGPAWSYAEIEFTAEPADAWEVQVSLPESDRVEMSKDEWLEEALRGVLEVLVGRPTDPLPRLRLNVTAARYSFESSRMAFRTAGRRAAEALLKATEVVP